MFRASLILARADPPRTDFSNFVGLKPQVPPLTHDTKLQIYRETCIERVFSLRPFGVSFFFWGGGGGPPPTAASAFISTWKIGLGLTWMQTDQNPLSGPTFVRDPYAQRGLVCGLARTRRRSTGPWRPNSFWCKSTPQPQQYSFSSIVICIPPHIYRCCLGFAKLYASIEQPCIFSSLIVGFHSPVPHSVILFYYIIYA
jgi:hypothetical protein